MGSYLAPDLSALSELVLTIAGDLGPRPFVNAKELRLVTTRNDRPSKRKQIRNSLIVAIIRNFSVTTDISLLPEISNSVGAHLAAKLEGFASDERTLTDELCDMICIWAKCPPRFSISRAAAFPMPIVLDINKVSPQHEVVIGADLELIVRSPLGAKRLLAQAKVLDPQSLKLRCDSVAGWEKLRVQLAKCRKEAPGLAYLLIYVPEGQLNGARYKFSTWEQGFVTSGRGADSRFGATLISVDKLIDKHDAWLNRPPLNYPGVGRFQPLGISFTQLLLEMFTCVQGVWGYFPSSQSVSMERDDAQQPYRLLDITVGGVEENAWAETVVPYFRGILNETREG